MVASLIITSLPVLRTLARNVTVRATRAQVLQTALVLLARLRTLFTLPQQQQQLVHAIPQPANRTTSPQTLGASNVMCLVTPALLLPPLAQYVPIQPPTDTWERANQAHSCVTHRIRQTMAANSTITKPAPINAKNAMIPA
eukprot:CAMPEP_0115038746 /NCGR_PEP_ID=MMETSP0216-20121206/43602_1 /TAXON_ID=223996 /ORGANISM="Protocruzia adherens, Strain Boccale" /LENGTH=140 /DNA_ID=CAMNT_0002419225 /DNA_START=48 /DNA_END=470 /DNA_ORIENTATION=-